MDVRCLHPPSFRLDSRDGCRPLCPSRSAPRFSAMRAACVLLVATAPLSLASQLASQLAPQLAPQPSRQHGKTAARGCVAPAAAPLLLRLRGGARTLAEGEWEALHEEAGDKLVVVGALRSAPAVAPVSERKQPTRCRLVAQISRPSGVGRARG